MKVSQIGIDKIRFHVICAVKIQGGKKKKSRLACGVNVAFVTVSVTTPLLLLTSVISVTRVACSAGCSPVLAAIPHCEEREGREREREGKQGPSWKQQERLVLQR